MVMDENPVGKRPLGRPRLRWEDVMKKYVEALSVEDYTGKHERRIGRLEMALMGDKSKKKKKKEKIIRHYYCLNILFDP
ncbi:Hypothetical protein CINCED_3A017736 [Cinara cedri]|uniref:Uncharacterized protein n=1 Tax=Cinara cedri TaxID=506608 RepID=A0A5E4NBP6_9HEMI|nr:Hypothetical protein CINCED_3A017736 [Cinara cedri]